MFCSFLLFYSSTLYPSKPLMQVKAKRACMRLHIEVKSVRAATADIYDMIWNYSSKQKIDVSLDCSCVSSLQEVLINIKTISSRVVEKKNISDPFNLFQSLWSYFQLYMFRDQNGWLFLSVTFGSIELSNHRTFGLPDIRLERYSAPH